MRAFTKLILSLLLIGIVACQSPSKQKKIVLFDFIPPQTSYIIKVNKPVVLQQSNPIILDAYLSQTDKNFLSKATFQLPFNLNILQNNSKIKGFIAVGKTSGLDSLFNGKSVSYDKFKIYTEPYRKQTYYATVIRNMTFISNQKMFIENCIRDRETFGRLSHNPSFNKGIQSLDNNAAMNVVSFLTRLKTDDFYRTVFKIKKEDIGSWQFFDLVESEKQIMTGISLSKDSTSVLAGIFRGIKPVKQNFAHLVPFAIDEAVQLSFDDFKTFARQLGHYEPYAPRRVVPNRQILNGLKALSYFSESQNKAFLLQFENPDKFMDNESEKVKDFNHYSIYKFSYNNLINSYFSNILPHISAQYYTLIDGQILITETEAYMEKVLNDIQNGSTLSHSEIYSKLKAEIPDAYQLILFRNKLALNGKKYMKAQTYRIESGTVFTNLILKNFDNSSNQTIIEQVLSYTLKDLPHHDPQLVYNHKTKTFNVIYQDEQNRLTLIDFKGKTLWQTAIKDKILGRIHQVDLLRNHKLQYTFVTSHHWHVIDRLGREVAHFPSYFLQPITQGISVFDYDKNRKYRFGITQADKFRLFDNQARKVKGFKVKTAEDIMAPPQHFRIGSKDFIQLQDAGGRLYLLNRRGEPRLKVSQKFETTRNPWGVYKQKFVNIDDGNHLIAISLSGQVKTSELDLGSQILSQIKFHTLAAVAGNNLLINKKLISLDLGNYSRPEIYKFKNSVLIFIANIDNNRVYAFDQQGLMLKNFPIIGQQILDFRADKTGRYLLVYDSAHNLIVYKF